MLAHILVCSWLMGEPSLRLPFALSVLLTLVNSSQDRVVLHLTDLAKLFLLVIASKLLSPLETEKDVHLPSPA